MEEHKKQLTDAQKKGRIGENAALAYLTKLGYSLITRNYFTRYGEIDIIVKNDNYIVFTEVKERSIRAIERPSAWVDSRKKQKLIKTALCYLAENPTELQPRFDVIEVICAKNDMHIEHIENAFDADYEYYEY